MNYYVVEPEVAGNFANHSVMDASVHPPKVHEMHYEFDGWDGDDLIESFASFVVTSRLALALKGARLSGFSIEPCAVSRSELYMEVQPSIKLPPFKWLKIVGTAGKDDFGMSAGHRLVVSERALAVLKEGHLQHCEVKAHEAQQGVPADVARPAGERRG